MVSVPKNINNFTEEEVKNFLDSFDTVLCDCDGVLWLENEVIRDSEKTVNKFIENKKKFFYVTNNNSKTREEYAVKCTKLGFSASKENIIATAYLAADYLKSINFNKKVYLIGNEGVVKELDKVGIKHTGIGPDPIVTNLENYIETKLKLDAEVGAVLVAFDQHFSYPKMLKAATYLKDPNCHFMATCSDESFPASSELLLPGMLTSMSGTGCFVRSLEAASGRKAYVLGKPNEYIKKVVLEMQKLDPARTLMIGDRCNTDILFGKRCGFQTLLVLTGVTSQKDVEGWRNSTNPEDHDLVPQYLINKLGDLLPYMS